MVCCAGVSMFRACSGIVGWGCRGETEEMQMSWVQGEMLWPWVVLVLDMPRLGQNSCEQVVRGAVAGGVSMVILRDRVSPAGPLLEAACAMRSWIPPGVLFSINDRLDIAMACGADGVHLPEQGLPVSVVREQWRPDVWVGRSIHSVDAARRAEQEGVDYLLLGTMFVTDCKPGHVPEGLSLLRDVCREVQVPVVGIGGIHQENAVQVWQAGAVGVAVASALMTAAEPASWVQQVRHKFQPSKP